MKGLYLAVQIRLLNRDLLKIIYVGRYLFIVSIHYITRMQFILFNCKFSGNIFVCHNTRSKNPGFIKVMLPQDVRKQLLLT